MSKLFAYFLTFCLCLVVQVELRADNNLPFMKFSFEEAEKMASKQGKLLFVDFYATWCGPCRWMEETTFQNEEVKSALKSNFISVRVNIDDFEGFALKSKYDVRYLPTMLLINPSGRVVERLEDTMTPVSLLQTLKTALKNDDQKSKPQTLNTNPKFTFKAAEIANLSVSEVEKHFNVTDKYYRLQVGVFSKQDGATKLINDLSGKLLEQTTVLQDYKDNKILYKVLMGTFESNAEAESYRKKLKSEFNIDSVVY